MKWKKSHDWEDCYIAVIGPMKIRISQFARGWDWFVCGVKQQGSKEYVSVPAGGHNQGFKTLQLAKNNAEKWADIVVHKALLQMSEVDV
jgi:hypothetical protein